MSIPAIRLGDPGATPGLITGSLTVLIGALPAAYVSVPITAALQGMSPAIPELVAAPLDGLADAPLDDALPGPSPDVLPPPILLPPPSVVPAIQWSTTVSINGQPAVRMGDLSSYGATLIAAQFTVLVG